jgi:hypothetical protein
MVIAGFVGFGFILSIIAANNSQTTKSPTGFNRVTSAQTDPSPLPSIEIIPTKPGRKTKAMSAQSAKRDVILTPTPARYGLRPTGDVYTADHQVQRLHHRPAQWLLLHQWEWQQDLCGQKYVRRNDNLQ